MLLTPGITSGSIDYTQPGGFALEFYFFGLLALVAASENELGENDNEENPDNVGRLDGTGNSRSKP